MILHSSRFFTELISVAVNVSDAFELVNYKVMVALGCVKNLVRREDSTQVLVLDHK